MYKEGGGWVGGGGMKSNYPATQYIGNAQFQGGKNAKL